MVTRMLLVGLTPPLPPFFLQRQPLLGHAAKSQSFNGSGAAEFPAGMAGSHSDSGVLTPSAVSFSTAAAAAAHEHCSHSASSAVRPVGPKVPRPSLLRSCLCSQSEPPVLHPVSPFPKN